MLPESRTCHRIIIPAYLWFAGGTLSATFPTIAAQPSSCSAHDIEELAHAQGASLLHVGGSTNTTTANGGSTNAHPEKQDPFGIAMIVLDKYVLALSEIGSGNLEPYLDMLCGAFVVMDPVGLEPQQKKDSLKLMLRDRQDLIMSEGFSLSVHAVSIAQNPSYSAVFSTMSIKGSDGKTFNTSRSDLLTIDPTGCISSAESYWSIAGSLLSTPKSVQYQTTEDTIRKYLKALHELGTNQSLDYFSQFAPEFEVHDPLGTPPITSVQELQGNIVELSKAVAPKGFAVTVEGVAIAADDHFGSAHLKLHLPTGDAKIPFSVDIIDIFEITKDGFVKILKAVWHI